MVQNYIRLGDMGEGTALVVHIQDDGDIIVGIGKPLLPGSGNTVEFCTVGMGGGRSERTFNALRALAKAIKEDNAESPLDYKGQLFPPKGWSD
jgi:hypothetical protein